MLREKWIALPNKIKARLSTMFTYKSRWSYSPDLAGALREVEEGLRKRAD